MSLRSGSSPGFGSEDSRIEEDIKCRDLIGLEVGVHLGKLG